MQQYLELVKTIKEKGTKKSSGREGMPGTTSLFGYQFRHDLSEGFPLLTTKKLGFKNIVVELLWFLKGDTNIKYLVDNGCNIWNEDAYNYLKKNTKEGDAIPTFEWFIELIKSGNDKLGDCGMQYGKLWREWETPIHPGNPLIIDTTVIPKDYSFDDLSSQLKSLQKEIGILPINFVEPSSSHSYIDQIVGLLQQLRTNPESRRHIISAWNPATLDQMALNACHALVQFNCRPLSKLERLNELNKNGIMVSFMCEPSHEEIDAHGAPRYKLDCQMYQRSADVFLGVPFNIASYSLLTMIFAKLCNMIPGDFIHTFGDVHIYDNHMDQIDLQLSRTPKPLPTLEVEFPVDADEFEHLLLEGGLDPKVIVGWLKNYDPHPAIKGKLSTGLQ